VPFGQHENGQVLKSKIQDMGLRIETVKRTLCPNAVQRRGPNIVYQYGVQVL
jgi:hypothetical protein